MACSSGRVWCIGGFDGQQTLGDTLCIDVQQLGQLKATSHSTQPETFAQPKQEPIGNFSASKEEPGSQDEGSETIPVGAQSSGTIHKNGAGTGSSSDKTKAILEERASRDTEADGRNMKASQPVAETDSKLEGTAMDTATLKELISEMKSGQISKKQNVELDSKHIACSIAQGSPLSPRLKPQDEDMQLPEQEKPRLSKAAVSDVSLKGSPKPAIRMLTAVFDEAEGMLLDFEKSSLSPGKHP